MAEVASVFTTLIWMAPPRVEPVEYVLNGLVQVLPVAVPVWDCRQAGSGRQQMWAVPGNTGVHVEGVRAIACGATSFAYANGMLCGDVPPTEQKQRGLAHSH